MKTVLEQALEALESSEKYLPAGHEHAAAMVAIVALKEAIAKQGEPVLWVDPETGDTSYTRPLRPTYVPLYTSAPTTQQGEPVVWLDGGVVVESNLPQGYSGPLFTSAPTIPEGWPIKGVRVDDDKVVIRVAGGNESARKLCHDILAMLSAAPKENPVLDYETVKRWKRDLMVNDPEFLTGRGRLESVEFHLAERIYLAGVADGAAVAAKLDEVVALLEQRGVGYANALELVQEVRKLVRVA